MQKNSRSNNSSLLSTTPLLLPYIYNYRNIYITYESLYNFMQEKKFFEICIKQNEFSYYWENILLFCGNIGRPPPIPQLWEHQDCIFFHITSSLREDTQKFFVGPQRGGGVRSFKPLAQKNTFHQRKQWRKEILTTKVQGGGRGIPFIFLYVSSLFTIM